MAAMETGLRRFNKGGAATLALRDIEPEVRLGVLWVIQPEEIGRLRRPRPPSAPWRCGSRLLRCRRVAFFRSLKENPEDIRFMLLVVPQRFNKNHPEVQRMGSAAETGSWLLNYMCERLGIPDLRDCAVLDFGCGPRFAEAIVNLQIPIKSYVGIDLDKDMIDFLCSDVRDPRLSFFHVDACNPGYNPNGEPLTVDTALPIGDRRFDVICMFSVITHQLPADAEALFKILRRYIKEDGQLFFSAALEEGDFGYAETAPEAPTACSIYSPTLLRILLQRSGWKIVSLEGKEPRGLPILDSLTCVPV
jgi:SAM-dependent methyltransferase